MGIPPMQVYNMTCKTLARSPHVQNVLVVVIVIHRIMEYLEEVEKLEKSVLKVFDKFHNSTNESSEADALELLSQLPNPAKIRDDDEDLFTLLHHACYNGWYEVAKVLIEKYNCDPNCKLAADFIPLCQACLNGTLDLVKYLILDKGCDPNYSNSKGQVPLHNAATGGHLHVVKFLIEHCMVDVTTKDGNGWSSLHYACKRGHLNLVIYLIEELQCNPFSSDKNGWTALHFACEMGYLDVVKYLIVDQKCNPSCKSESCQTPLHLACLMGHLHIAKYLIEEQECYPACGDRKYWTPLHFACESGHLDVIKYLIEKHCNPECKNDDGQTPLHSACLMGRLHVVQYLVNELDCDPACRMTLYSGDTPLHYACNGGHLNVAKYLIENQWLIPSIINKIGQTSLHAACLNGHLHIVKYLIEDCKCDPGCIDNDGSTPLHYASGRGHLEVVKYLIEEQQAYKKENSKMRLSLLAKYFIKEEKCTLTCTTNNGGQTPLHFACDGGHLHVVKYLIEDCHMEPSISDTNSWTPLHAACLNGHLSIATYLIEEKQCSPVCHSSNGTTPLHASCQEGHLDVVKYLIEELRCNPKCKGNFHWTPLHSACKGGHLSVAKYLIEKGKSDPKCRVDLYGGASPLSLACTSHQLDLVKYLVNECNCNLINSEILLSNDFVRNDTDIALFLISSCEIKGSNAEHKDLLLYPAFKIFVMGNFSSGKSTLVKAIQEHFQAQPNFLQRIMRQHKIVSDVELCTVGIVSINMQIPNCGRVIMYDFAGQAEYYSSHAALCENLMTSQGCLIIVLFNLSKDLSECVQEVQFWQLFINNQLRSCTRYPPIMFVASYADVVKSQGLDPAKKVKQVIETSFGEKFHDQFMFLDCRQKYSPGLQTISESIIKYCSTYQENNVIETKIHLLLYIIRLHFKEKTACLQEDVFKLLITLKKNELLDRNIQLPESINELSDLLTILNENGELLLLRSSKNIGKTWIILKKDTVLREINGTIFAPERFRNHCEISNSTGVVPLSNIKRVFPHHDPQMLVGFMIHLELCHEISESEANLINEQDSLNGAQNSESYYFFPALVKVELSKKPYFNQTNIHKCGWCLQRVNTYEYLTSRFLHILLLRLAFTFALRCEQADHSIVLQRECNIWKSGIHWVSIDGVEVVVEVVEQNTTVVVVFVCTERENIIQCIQLRSAVIHLVLSTVSQFCGTVKLKEYFVDPNQLNSYPLKNVSDLVKFSTNRLALAIKEKKDIITVKVGESFNKTMVDNLLYFEPYTCLSNELIACLHSGEEKLNKTISDNDLVDIANVAYPKQSKLKEILPINESDLAGAVSQCDELHRADQSHQCFLLLRTWRDGNETSTYNGLRKLLDSFSIFCGRNPLVGNKNIICHFTNYACLFFPIGFCFGCSPFSATQTGILMLHSSVL